MTDPKILTSAFDLVAQSLLDGEPLDKDIMRMLSIVIAEVFAEESGSMTAQALVAKSIGRLVFHYEGQAPTIH